MNSNELRKQFTHYFESLGHKVFPSDSLIPSSDPTLLFTTAGMVQFKDYFIGKKTGLKRACSVQKCLRTSDIERVGHTFRHLTFFEMLGNFSFGDYFKKEAIEWAWDFITRVVKLDENKLYITVFKDDQEAFELWSRIAPKDRIYKLSEETNFWKMGDTGPCGPCSEILYDLGEEYGCGKPTCSPACDCDRYLEVWNLVFTQFDLQPDGNLLPLKQKNIDTGMGLERLCMVVNNFKNVFETDLFVPIRNEILKYVDVDLNASKKTQNYLNAISDHIRAATFAISEGVIPTNEERGYVVRKILRRAIRYVKLLGYNQSLLYKIVPVVVDTMKEIYPELKLHREKVSVIIKAEEEKFLETLESGLHLINTFIKESKNIISGEVVFKLYDTYGFPKELVDEILKENNISYDEKEFYETFNKAKEISKLSWKGVKVNDNQVYLSFPETNFVGYESYVYKANILGIIRNKQIIDIALKGENVEILVDTTPFYGESGGQVGDKGVIKKENKVIAEVLDTKKIENRIIHIVKLLSDIKISEEVVLEIDVERRKNIMRHHTATHLLHKALQEVLGEHAIQSGSLVTDDYFRFDFIHWRAISTDELLRIENIVNQKILECLPVSIFYTDINTAKNLGAMALFEEKYKEQVRIVAIGGKIENGQIKEQPFSMELCGGTHCSNTGEIGIFKIMSESSVGTNIRRIEGICGKKVYDYINNLHKKITSIGELIGTNNIDEICIKVSKLIQQNKSLQQEIENLKLNFLSQKVEEVEKEVKGVKFIIKAIPETDLKILRSLADNIIKNYQDLATVILLYSITGEKISVVIKTSAKALQQNLNAKHIAEKINKALNIKCGGRDDFVQGGGSIDKKITPGEILKIITEQ